MTTTHHLHDVPLPAGAEWYDYSCWEDVDHHPWRVIRTVERAVEGRDVTVYAEAVQYADGSLGDGREAPGIKVEFLEDDGISAGQARELAAALLEAADETDRLA
jgi:hypothetical protein